jgi:tetratricopeptide (TPR) repeat protein
MFYNEAGAVCTGFFFTYLKNGMDPSEFADLDIENLAARLSENPRSPLFARLADLYLSRRRVGEAVALCERGITLYPTYAGGHIVLGKCYQQRGEFTKARASYQQALGLSPYNTVVHRLLVALPETADALPFGYAEGPLGTITDADEIVQAETPTETPVETHVVIPVDNAAAALSPTDALPPMSSFRETPADEAPAVYTEIPSPAATPAAADDRTSENIPVSSATPDVSDDRTPENIPVLSATPDASDNRLPEDIFGEMPIVSAKDIHDEMPMASAAPPEETPAQYEPYPTFEQYIDLHPTASPTMTLEEYLKGRVAAPQPDPSTDFESLAKQLQNAKRIVPTDTPLPPPTSVDESASTRQAIVSPTMAEIYVSQNEFDAAIAAYEALSARQPEQSAVFAKRIEDIKALRESRRTE